MKKKVTTNPWRQRVQEQLPLLGHRNWIAVVDSAYPWQTAPGIETLSTGARQLAVVDFVLRAVTEASHIRPIIYLDAELASLTEKKAPGITTYRKELNQLLRNDDVETLPHEKIIAQLNKAGNIFRILILKSTLTLPYTSVFMKLDCGYA